MATVLSNDAAKDSAVRIQTLLAGDFYQNVTQLNTDGEVLADPANWAGPSADKFRAEWEQIAPNLYQLQRDLADLTTQIQGVLANIQAAGGNAGG